MAKRSKQYSFHLNLNNPDHLKIYRTLEDLNTDIHKSVSNFVIKAVIQYINDASRASLTKSGKNEKENLEGYVTRQELSEANKATTTSGRALGSEEAIAKYIADMLLLESDNVFNIRYTGTTKTSGETFYEFRCYR